MIVMNLFIKKIILVLNTVFAYASGVADDHKIAVGSDETIVK